MLADLLQKNRTAIKARWLELTLATYREDTAGFLLAQKDIFANPVGQTLARETGAVVDGLLGEADPVDLCLHLEEMIKVRAIQEFSPSEAVSFVLLLKDAIREKLSDHLHEAGIQAELIDFESRIDQLVLFAFDIFVKWREQVYSIRLREIKAGYVQTQ